jgi:hypothetical protein
MTINLVLQTSVPTNSQSDLQVAELSSAELSQVELSKTDELSVGSQQSPSSDRKDSDLVNTSSSVSRERFQTMTLVADASPKALAAETLQVTPANGDSQSQGAKKLPYQVNHQVELLNLQAETEALLQELQTLKQRRLVTADSAHVD